MQLPQLQFRSDPICKRCDLNAWARSVCVPTRLHSSGLTATSDTPAIIFLGMNPGIEEDRSNQAFVGRSGQLVTKSYIDAPRINTRATIYLTNTARCYSPAAPRARHYNACFPLFAKPDILEICYRHDRVAVVCLGAVASEHYLRWVTDEKHSQQQAFKLNGKLFHHAMDVGAFGTSEIMSEATHFSTYHPAAVLRNPNLIYPVSTHLELLSRWLDKDLVVPSKPTIVPVRSPP